MPARPNGDLRADLLRVGRVFVEREGYEAISIRQLATAAGVSSGAPYYHFNTRRDLLLALAEDGFEELHAIGTAIVADPHGSAEQKLVALADAFLDFCAAQPRLADLMYESELTRPVAPELEPKIRQGFDLMTSAVRETLDRAPESLVLARSVSLWVALFGLSRILRFELLEPAPAQAAEGWRETVVTQMILAAIRQPDDAQAIQRPEKAR